MVEGFTMNLAKSAQRVADRARRIRARAPVRICDLGGWTDCRFVPRGAVLNMTVDLYAHCLVSDRDPHRQSVTAHGHRAYEHEADRSVRIQAPDLSEDDVDVAHVRDIEYDGTLDLLKAAVKRLGDAGGVEALVWADVPPGCGVGSSAAVAVALVAALASLRDRPMALHEIAQVAQELETEELGLECGVQDQFASAYGGICFMEVEYPRAIVSPVPVRQQIVRELEERLLLVYTGQSRLSDQVHRHVIGGYESGDQSVRDAIETLTQTPYAMRDALVRGSFAEMAEALNANWEAQKALHPTITNELIEKTFEVARRHGAVAGKANGAGGGGSLTLLVEPGREWSVRRALSEIPELTLLPCRLCFDGVRTWEVP